MNRRIFVLFPLILFCVSLLLPALGVSGRSEYGYSVLATGWFQSYIAISAIANWYSHDMLSSDNFWPSLLMIFPWLANIFIVSSLGFLASSKERLAAVFCIFALVCVIVFFINPVAMLGPDGMIVTVTPLFGAYLWALSTVVTLWLIVARRWSAKEHT
uniref:hypothetical protein n=1 Tax=Microbulbifer agarilyticus TaxID=260552 RepID=UPI001110A8C7|nr:hypothetical protein [Microbulbifer agarilyticus]